MSVWLGRGVIVGVRSETSFGAKSGDRASLSVGVGRNCATGAWSILYVGTGEGHERARRVARALVQALLVDAYALVVLAGFPVSHQYALRYFGSQ